VTTRTADNRDSGRNASAHVAVGRSRAREGAGSVPKQERLTDAQRLTICELADEGYSVREVAAQLKVAPSTITRNAQRMGLSFDRSATERATAARVADAKARRAQTAARLIELVNAELDRLDRPYRVHSFVGGQDATYLEHVLPQPDAPARLAIIRAAGHLVDKHLKLAGFDGDASGLEQAKSVMGAIYEGLVRAYPDLEREEAAR
jgi:transposase-like protein